MEVKFENPFDCYSIVVEKNRFNKKDFLKNMEFQIRKKYPFDSSSCILHVKKSKRHIIITVIPKSKFELEKNIKVLLPVHFLFNYEFCGVTFLLHDEWVIWLEKKNYQYVDHGIVNIEKSNLNNVLKSDSIFDRTDRIIIPDGFNENFFDDEIVQKCRFLKYSDFIKQMKKSRIKIQNSCNSFQKKNLFIFVYLLCISIMFVTYKHLNIKLNTKKEQLLEKNNILKKLTSGQNEKKLDAIKEKHSFIQLLGCICEVDSSLKLYSYSSDGKKISIEGVCSSSSEYMNKIKNLGLAKNINLNSVTVQDNGIEKFKISGEIDE